MTTPNKTLVIEGDSIQVYRVIAIVHGLELEIKMQRDFQVPPTACPTRGLALRAARGVARSLDHPGTLRTRKQAVAYMRGLAEEMGLDLESNHGTT